MSEPFIDTDVIIRFLTGDDLKKQAEAAILFHSVEVGRQKLMAPDTVIADAVYVLSSPRLYHKSHSEIQALLAPLVRLAGFRVQNRRSVLRALDLYATTNLDFSDTLIVSMMEQRGSRILYSYDQGFDRSASVDRRVPGV